MLLVSQSVQRSKDSNIAIPKGLATDDTANKILIRGFDNCSNKNREANHVFVLTQNSSASSIEFYVF